MDLEDPLQNDEIKAAIYGLPSGKSPGPNGLPVEFFRKLSVTEPSPLLMDMYLESLEVGYLPHTLLSSFCTHQYNLTISPFMGYQTGVPLVTLAF